MHYCLKNLILNLILLIASTGLFGLSASVIETAESENCNSSRTAACISKYDSELVKIGFTKKLVEEILQHFYLSELGKSFSQIGIWDDFFHGHYLHSKNKKVIGILFHTQENWKTPGVPKDIKDYKFLNKNQRNMIYWLDGEKKGKIENADSYVDSNLTGPYWKKFKDHGTVTPDMIDEKKIGYKLKYISKKPNSSTKINVPEGFHFFQVDCSFLKKDQLEQSSIIQIKNNENVPICLDVTRSFCSPTDIFREAKDLKCPKDCLFEIDRSNSKIYN